MKVIIEATITPNIWHLTGTVKLRIYARQSFFNSDGQWVPQGTPGRSNTAYLEVECTVIGNELTIPSFEIDSTVDGLDNIFSTYDAELVAGSRRYTFLSGFAINTLEDGDPSTTWSEIILLRNLFVPQTLDENLTRQIAALIQTAVGDLNKASSTNTGGTALDVDPVDPGFPIAVGINSPLLLSLQGGTIDATQAPYGVLNDGTPQSTAGLQAALDAARDSNGQYTSVELPPGQYVFNSGSLTIWQGLALIGSWLMTQGHSWKRFSNLPDATDGRGTTFQITAGSGTSTGAFITMHSNTLLRGIVFYYPNQLVSAVTPTAYPWTVFIGKAITEGVGDVTVEDCEFVNSYQAVQCKWSARLHLRNIGGAPVFGIDIDKAYDSTWFENVQWNTYRFSSFDAGAPNNNYGIYVNQNGVGIKVGRVDNLMLLNCFVLGYGKGLETVETATEGALPGGKPWMQVVGGGFESCKWGVYLAAAQNPRIGEGAGIELVDVNISGYDHVAANGGFGIFVTAAFTGDLKVIGGRLGYGSGPDHISNIVIVGGGRVTIQNVQFIHATSHNIFADAPGGGGGLGDLALTVVANQFEASVLASIAVEGFTTGLIAANNFVSKTAGLGLSTQTAITSAAEAGYVVTITPDNRFGDNVFPFGTPSSLLGKLFSAVGAIEIYSNLTHMARSAARQGSITLRGHDLGTVGLGSLSINAALSVDGTTWLRQVDANDAWLIQTTSTTGSTGSLTIYHAPPGAGNIVWTAFLSVGADGQAQIAMKTKAGAPVDGDFTNPRDGLFALDTANHRLYVRSGSAWRFLQLP